MKQITIDGRLGKDAVLGTTKNGREYLRFSVANTTFSKADGEKTEWFDVTTYDDFAIKYRQSVLKKGSYVIVTGTLNSEISTKDSKIWLNHYVNATDINVPNLGTKKENLAPKVDAPTVPTPSIPTPTVDMPSVEERLNTSVQNAVAANNVAVVDEEDDDLPF